MNLYQSVLDEAQAKRRELNENGWQPSPRLLQKVGEYRRDQEARRTSECSM